MVMMMMMMIVVIMNHDMIMMMNKLANEVRYTIVWDKLWIRNNVLELLFWQIDLDDNDDDD